MTSASDVEVGPAAPGELPAVRALLLEYADALDFSLDFQDFEGELASLPGEFAPPGGALLVARVHGEVAGCVALRRLDGRTCEMKRLFVRSRWRGRRLGGLLADAVIAEARRLAYARMRLDTVPGMEAAQALYESLGFREIEPYRTNPVPGARFLELDLERVRQNHGMRVFVAGATGVIGQPLVRRLVADGHVVAGMTRSPGKAELLRGLGAEPVVCDAYDAEGLRAAVAAFAPDVVIDELTDLPDEIDRIDAAANARMRLEGHGNLLRAAGGARVLAQSVAWETEGETRRGVEELERTTLDAGGVVLRYGYFYGPGTYSDGQDALPPEPRVQVDEAARRTVEALDAPSGVIVVTDP